MSEKFGLDWKEHDAIRMAEFVEIIRIESEKARKEQGKTDGPKFRKRQ